MAKGNFKDTRRDATRITELNSQYHNEIEEYKKFATARRNRRKFTQVKLIEYWQKLNEYLEDCRSKKEPLTVAGLLLALDINSMTYSRMSEEYDYLLQEAFNIYSPISEEYDIEGMPVVDAVNNDTGEVHTIALVPYSWLKEKCELYIQRELEINCAVKNNPVGSIFRLKAQHGFRDNDGDQVKNLTQNLVISDSSRAKEIIKMLNG